MTLLRNILLLSAASAAAASDRSGLAAPPRAHELDGSYTYEQYLAHFDKSYDDPDEYSRRSRIFANNMKTILSHNEGRLTEDGELIGGGYAMGVNAFTDMDEDELYFGYDKLKHPHWRDQLEGGGVSKTERRLADSDTKSYSKDPDFQVDDVSSLPESIDWSEQGKVNPTIPQQGGCGSCWTFAATGAIEAHLAIATGEDPVTLSEQTLLVCTPNPEECGGKGSCTGATVELALNYLADVTSKKTGGMYSIDAVPYSTEYTSPSDCEALTKGKRPVAGVEGWTRLPANDYQATMNGVAKEGPLAVAVTASGWSLYEKGVYGEKGDGVVNHAVLLVGYGVDEKTGEKYYKIRNSWGPGFGEAGFIRVKRTDDDSNLCQTDNDPLVGIACALDDSGNKIEVKPAKVCGTNAVLFDVAYPRGVHKIE